MSETSTTENPLVASYGDDPEQFGTLTLPDETGPLPVVVLVHGGFWREQYRADLMEPLAEDLVQQGYATWNIEYRKLGQHGGGYPGTTDDVTAAIDHLAVLVERGAPLDLERVAVVGHSAGGHLALWSGMRDNPVVQPALVVGQAPVADLGLAHERRLGNFVVDELMGGSPDEVPDAYAAIDPASRFADAVAPQLIVQGSDDTIVPADYVRVYVEAATQAGIDITYNEVEGGDHFNVIDPTHELWQLVTVALALI